MCPFVHANYFILGSAVAASFAFGYFWYGPLFGKVWAQLMGIQTGKSSPKSSALLLTLLGTVLTVFVLAYFVKIYKPYCAFGAAFFVWLGFYLPRLLGSVAWENHSWKLFALNAVYYFLNLQLIATVLFFWRS